MTRFFLPLAFGLALAGCGDSARYLVETPPAATSGTVALRLSSIELKDITLPAHASGPEVLIQSADGALVSVGDADWADEPVRAYSAALARHLDQRSSATVATEPWPLFERAQAELVVRIDRMLARADGQFELSAQVAITSAERVVRDRIERFSLTTPLPSPDAAGVASASGTALQLLAERILAMLARQAG